MSTAYDETVGRARRSAEGWAEDARGTAEETRETLHEGADRVRERAGELYERTAGGFRRVGRRASEYGHMARDAVRPDGALLNFCREQPLVVAGLGLAFGAALAAMIPASRVEREAMGDTSRRVQDRIKETAQDTWRAVGGERSAPEDDVREQGSWREGRAERAANDGGSNPSGSGIGRSETSSAARRAGGQTESMGSREAAAEVERGVKQSDRASNIETEPSRAPYAEAAEAGAAGSSTMPGEETKPRT